jgi:integrase
VKTANGDGTIGRRKDGRWDGRYFVQIDGAWKRRSVYGTTRAQVRQRLREAIKARDGGLTPAPARETVRTYLTTWLAGIEPTLAPRTRDSYAQIVHDHLAPAFERVPLTRLTPQQVQRTYRDGVDPVRWTP